MDTVSWSSTSSFDLYGDDLEGLQTIEEFQKALVQKRNLDREHIVNWRGARGILSHIDIDFFDEEGQFKQAGSNHWMLVKDWWKRCVSTRTLLNTSDLAGQIWRSFYCLTLGDRFLMTEQG